MRLRKDAGRCSRSASGQMHPAAKLTNNEVELIRQLHEDGMSVRAIARKMEISKSQVCRIVNYDSR